MLPEIQSMLTGAERGKMQLSGTMPSAMDVGGAPSNVYDPASSEWDIAFKALSRLADTLHRQRRELVANKVAKIAVQLQHLSLEQRKKIAENAAGNSSAEGNPMETTGDQNSMAVPNNY